MTNEEIHAAAEVIVLRMRLNDPVDFTNDFKYWLEEDQTNKNHKKFQTIIDDTTDTSYGLVHGFLLENGFIGRPFVSQEIKYLTDKGDTLKRAKTYKKYISKLRTKRCIEIIKDIVGYAIVPLAILITLYFTWCLWQLENSARKNNDISNVTSTSKQNHP